MARIIPAWGTPEWANEYTARYGFPPLGGGAPDPAPDPDSSPDPDPAPDDPDPEPEPVKPDDDWKAKSRKNETRAKKAEKDLAAAQARLKELEEAGASEQEKAIAKAREEAATEISGKYETERRNDRLEVASTRLAAKGFQLGEGEDAKTVKFADPDDALIYLRAAIDRGTVDSDGIFDDEGKVQTDALQTALADILETKPHLRASENGGKPNGNPDTRRGNAASTDLEAMSPADHEKRKYGAPK